jgi:PKD repeat protein
MGQVPNFVNQDMSTGWDQVVSIEFDSLGRMFVVERAGKVWCTDSTGVKSGNPLIDISEEVGSWRDHGLNGFALDPDFLSNGYFYLFYTVDRHHLINFGTASYNPASNQYYEATIARVTRYQADTATGCTTLVPGSRLILIGENKTTGIPILHESHSGGDLLFGADGSLLVTTGDGASYSFVDDGGGNTYWSQALSDSIIRPEENVGAFRSQMVNCLNGKLLRIDPNTGDGLNSNPYYDPSNPRSPRSRVWSLGLRNPYRATLRPGTGEQDITAGNPGVVYLGDVGWANWEDINIITGPGQNFGWPLYEGLTPQTGYQNTEQVNFDAPNALYDTSTCNLPFYKFEQLLIQDTKSPSFVHPCDTTINIPDSLTYVHARPVIDYKHGLQTRTGIYSGDSAAVINTNDSLSPVQGPMFGGYSSIGGVWYNDDRFPLQWQNTYFHSDYVGQWIRNMVVDTSEQASQINQFWDNNGNIVCLALNPASGCITYVAYPDKIREICYTGVINNPPVAVADADTIFGFTPLTVSFSSVASSDPENLPLTYFWDFGDGDTSTLANPVHIYDSLTTGAVQLFAKLTVTDDIGQSHTDSISISLNNTPPEVDITSLDDGDLYSMNGLSTLSLEALVTDAEHSLNDLLFSWQTILQHNSHQHLESADTNKVTSTTISPAGCVSFESYYFRIILSVTDPAGLTTVDSVRLYPACSPPNASFTADAQHICPGDTVSFTDLSTIFPIQWKWILPGADSTVANSQNPVVTYDSAGVYDVTLIASSFRGSDTLTIPQFITVHPVPDIMITTVDSVQTVCAGSQLELIANSVHPISQWQWLESGADISGATGSTFLVDSTGQYEVHVIDTNGCVNTSQPFQTVQVPLPVAEILSADTVMYCAGDSIALLCAGLSGSLHQWFIDSIQIPGVSDTILSVILPGNYTVQVVDSFGCSMISDPVNVQELSLPVVSLDTSGTLLLCEADTFLLGISGALVPGYSLQWYIGDSLLINETGSEIQITGGGSYFVSVIDSNGCVNRSDTVEVIMNQLPSSGIQALSGNYFCENDSVLLQAVATTGSVYQWLTDSVPIPGATDSLYYVTGSGVYQIEVTGQNGCKSVSEALPLTLILNPIVNITSVDSLAFCLGDSITLNATSDPFYSYQWKKYANILTGQNNSSIVVSQAGKYVVIVTDTAGCQTTSSPVFTSIIFPPAAQIIASGNTSFCPGDSVILSASHQPGYSYEWKRYSNYLPGETDSALTVTKTGKYSVRITDQFGCVALSPPVFTSVLPLPNAVLTTSGNLAFCPGDTITLSASTAPGYTFEWRRYSTMLSGETDSILKVYKTGKYKVFVTDSNGCVKGSNPLVTTVLPLPNAQIYATGGLEFCPGDSVTLKAVHSPGYTYQWRRYSQNLLGETDSSLTITQTGKYKALITDSAGCTKGSNALITELLPGPVALISASGSLNLCIGDTLTLLAYHEPGYTYDWKKYGNSIPGATDSVLKVTTSGQYKAVVTDSSGCSLSSNKITPFLVACFTHLGEMGVGQGVSVHDDISIILYPNPVSELLTIEFFNARNQMEDIRISMFDVSGKIVFSKELDLHDPGHNILRVPVSSFPDGIYTVWIVDGSSIYSERVIIAH